MPIRRIDRQATKRALPPQCCRPEPTAAEPPTLLTARAVPARRESGAGDEWTASGPPQWFAARPMLDKVSCYTPAFCPIADAVRQIGTADVGGEAVFDGYQPLGADRADGLGECAPECGRSRFHVGSPQRCSVRMLTPLLFGRVSTYPRRDKQVVCRLEPDLCRHSNQSLFAWEFRREKV